MFKTLDSGNIITEFGHLWSACEYLLGYELLYENIDQTLPDKLPNNVPTHYKISVTRMTKFCYNIATI